MRGASEDRSVWHVTLPETLPYEPGQPTPPGYTPRLKPTAALVVAGALAFGVSCGISLLIGGVDAALPRCDDDVWFCSNERYWPLTIPVVGPLIAVATKNRNAGTISLLMLDALVQGGGLTLLILGLARQRVVFVRNDLANLVVVPVLVGNESVGVGLSGNL